MFFLDLQTLRAGDEGWLVLDVTAASDRWLLNRNKDLGLRLYVETEDGRTQGLGSGPSPGGSSEAAGSRRSWSPLNWPAGHPFPSSAAGVIVSPRNCRAQWGKEREVPIFPGGWRPRAAVVCLLSFCKPALELLRE